MIIFNNIIFPKFTRDNFIPTNDKYFDWFKTDMNHILKLVQFNNCTFNNFDIYRFECETLLFIDVTIQEKLTVSQCNINRLNIKTSKNINTLNIECLKSSDFIISDSNANSLILNHITFNQIEILDSVFKKTNLNDLSIEHGKFYNTTINEIKSFSNNKF